MIYGMPIIRDVLVLCKSIMMTMAKSSHIVKYHWTVCVETVQVNIYLTECRILVSFVYCLFRYLYKNQLRSIDVEAFRGLTNLEQL